MDTEYCTNCKRDIATVNFIMHEVHCRRNITLCTDCQEPVPRSEMDDHFEEYHKPVDCKCGKTIEISKVEDHEKNDCVQRIQHCEYCELELPHIQMVDHLDYCASRTECCPRCQRYIQNRDRDQHDITNCQHPEQKPPTATTNQASTNRDLFDDLDDYDETTFHSRTNRFAFPQYVDPSSVLADASGVRATRNVNLISTIPSAQFYRTSNVSNEESESGVRDTSGGGRNRRQRKNQDRVQNIYKNTNQRRTVASKKKDATKPSNTTAADQLEADRLLALRLSNEEENLLTENFLAEDFLAEDSSNSPASLRGDFQLPQEDDPDERGMNNIDIDALLNTRAGGSASPPRRRGNSFSRASQSSVQDIGDFIDAADTGRQSDVVMAPCEFCGRTFPLDDLILHETGCQIESLDQMFEPSSPTSVPSANNNQQPNFKQGSAPTQTPVLDNLRTKNPQRLISPDPVFHHHVGSSEEGSVMLPCEFCGDLLPSEFLPHHQFHCRESRPMRSNQEVESALLDPFVAPSRTSQSTSLPGPVSRTKHSQSQVHPVSPPKNRSSRRRQDDVMLQNVFPPSEPDNLSGEGKNSPARQSSKVKRSLSQGDDLSSGTRSYNRSSGTKNSNRNRTGAAATLDSASRLRKTSKGGVKENDVDDFQLDPEFSYLGSNHRAATLPLGASNTDLRSKPAPKKFTNSYYVNDNRTSKPALSHRANHVLPTSSAARPPNNINRHTERQNSFHEPLSQYGGTLSNAKKPNSGRISSKGAGVVGTERGAGAAMYVPSFGTALDGGGAARIQKTANANSARLAANFASPVDGVRKAPPGMVPGLEPGISSLSSRSRANNNRPTSKTRSKVNKRPSSPTS